LVVVDTFSAAVCKVVLAVDKSSVTVVEDATAFLYRSSVALSCCGVVEVVVVVGVVASDVVVVVVVVDADELVVRHTCFNAEETPSDADNLVRHCDCVV
jgi:hypothetical protein